MLTLFLFNKFSIISTCTLKANLELIDRLKAFLIKISLSAPNNITANVALV